jgi:tetratricopeptide (TPR) repeat protein
MATSAKDLLARLETRFPGDEKADLRVGWCYIQVNDAPAALRIFRAAVATMKPQEKPDTELLAGLSLALWLNQRQAEAIATYKQLIIEHNRRLIVYEDLAKPETFMRRALPQAAILSLKSLRTETLKLHPELGGKSSPEN